MWYECQHEPCGFATNSPKQAKLHEEDFLGHVVVEQAE